MAILKSLCAARHSHCQITPSMLRITGTTRSLGIARHCSARPHTALRCEIYRCRVAVATVCRSFASLGPKHHLPRPKPHSTPSSSHQHPSSGHPQPGATATPPPPGSNLPPNSSLPPGTSPTSHPYDSSVPSHPSPEQPQEHRFRKRLIPAAIATVKLLAKKLIIFIVVAIIALLVLMFQPLLEGDAWKNTQEKSLLHQKLPLNRFDLPHEDEWRQSAADAMQELLNLPPCRLIFVSAPHNAGKSSFVLSILEKFPAVAYLNLSKYGSCNSIDDLVQLLTEQFNIWSGPKVGKDIRNVVELLGLPREAAEPRVFNRRELSSLLATIEGILDHYIAQHPNKTVPIFFADDAQALAGLLFAGHFQAKEADSGRERRDAHEALRDFFAWAAAMSKAGKCHFIVASTPSFFFQALSSGALFDDYIIPIELPELTRDDAVHYLVEHGVKEEKAERMINANGSLLGTLDALSVLTNTGLGRLGFSNARFFEQVDSAFEPETMQYRPDPQFAEEMKPRWTPGQWLLVLDELTKSADGAVSMVKLLNKEGMTREALRSLIEHNLVMYRVSLPTQRGPFITASHSGLRNSMEEYIKNYLPNKAAVLRVLLCEEGAAKSAPSSESSSTQEACQKVNVRAPLSVRDVIEQVDAEQLSYHGTLLTKDSHLIPVRNGDVIYYSPRKSAARVAMY